MFLEGFFAGTILVTLSHIAIVKYFNNQELKEKQKLSALIVKEQDKHNYIPMNRAS